MNVLLVTLLIEIFFLLLELRISNSVFVNPSLLSIVVIFGSTLLGTIGNIFWKVPVSPILIYVVISGYSAIVIADLTAKMLTPHRKASALIKSNDINLNNQKVNFVLWLVVICTLLYCLDILKAGATMGRSGLSAIYAVKRDNSRTNPIIRQGVKFVMAAMFIHTFVFANNVLVLKKKGWANYKHCIPAVCAIICCIFTSVRTEIFRVITAVMVDLCIILFQRRNWNRRSLRPFIKKIIPFVGVGGILLVGLKSIVKGSENATSNTFGSFMYILYYLGTPLVVLGYKIEDGIKKYQGNVPGELTFNRFYAELQERGYLSNVHLQDGSRNVWIDKSNNITANVDTIFGSPVIDFGIIGMMVYLFLVFLFLNIYFYHNIYKTKVSINNQEKIITYSFLASIASMAYYTNYTNQYLTIYFLLTFILIKIIEKFYKIKIRT